VFVSYWTRSPGPSGIDGFYSTLSAALDRRFLAVDRQRRTRVDAIDRDMQLFDRGKQAGHNAWACGR